MATINVTPSGIPTLREAINAAAAGDVILLANGTYASVRSLAKQTSVPGVVQASGYAVTGTSEAGTIIKDTRIFQRNVDGAFGPGSVENLTLDYTAGGLSDGGALLRATSGSFLVRDVTFTGTHTGWNGNGNLYMSLTSFSATTPITADLTLDDVTVRVKGQTGFNPVTGAGGSAFLHSWNNNGSIRLVDSLFDEAGFLSSFNILNFTGSVAAGSVQISGNTFTRSENQTVVRPTGNILGNVTATLSGNTFENGSYLDLYEVNKLITLTSNTFSTIANGFGLRITGPTVGVLPVLTGTNVFNGPGLALKYVDAGDNKSISLTGTSTVNGTAFTKLTAGGQGNDTLTLAAGFTDWVSGDDGNDSISTGDLADLLLGGAGNDTLTGGTGNDTVRGGAGSDTILYSVGSDGVDAVDGGSDTDTLQLTSGAGNQTLSVNFDGVSITGVAGGTVAGIESVTADLGDGTGDTLTYTASGGVSVNLAAGTASGFTSIAGIENATGNGGADFLLGDDNANVLVGNGNDDTLQGAGGNDTLTGGTGNDTILAGAGNDTISYTVGSHGVDSIDGGADVDTLALTSGAGGQTLSVTFDGVSITGVAGGSVTGVESLTANLGGGTDTLAYNSLIGVSVNLFTSAATGFSAIANIENVAGGTGADLLAGSGGGNTLAGNGGDDVIDGGGGNDILNGGLGADLLAGGTADDTFLYGNNVAESGTTAATRDIITDFQGAGVAGGDVINVNAIDANTGAGGNQNFTFIGNAAFSAAGQLRFFQDGTNTFVEANTTGVTGAEFSIQVNGLHTFVAADFVL